MEAKSRLGDVLILKNIITEEILSEALERQAQEGTYGRKLGNILVSDFGIDHHEVFSTLAEIFAFRSISIEPSKLESNKIKHARDILNKINDNVRKELLFNNILPFQLLMGARSTLIVLTCDVTNKVIEKIAQQTEFKRYEVIYCPIKVLEELIQLISPQKNEFLELLNEVDTSSLVEEEDHSQVDSDAAIDEEMNKSLLVNLFEGCLMEAVRRRASDIHIIPYKKKGVDFHFRIDSKLQLWHRQDNTQPEAMAAVVKDRSTGIDRFERATAQDGFAQRVIDGHLIRFRVSIIPITSEEFERNFESIVIRVIDDRNVVTDLKALGFQEKAEADFLKALSHSKGMVLVTGPTGSGKSTTLMAALFHVADPSKNILTCEDPVEYMIKAARQIKISSKLSFDGAIRAILRHDPDIVLVGEIRDAKTAEIAVKLSNTGHLTLSTLHTNDAPATVSRLFKMGIEPFLLANVISIIIAQRLIRKLCPECKRPISKRNYEQALAVGLTQEDLDSGKCFEPGPGCKKCNQGYKGRTNICEALYFSPEVKSAILQNQSDIDEDQIRKIAESQGMLSMRVSGLYRIREGITSVEEIIYSASDD
ncbi:MAG: Flp pilus assembly complex ATPase component TadA [Candidatus Cloacimonetes bacterium]|nr:Flp pilus assembly complex ATPase component TadA [Candidatus Cloacimonadota bacterium]